MTTFLYGFGFRSKMIFLCSWLKYMCLPNFVDVHQTEGGAASLNFLRVFFHSHFSSEQDSRVNFGTDWTSYSNFLYHFKTLTFAVPEQEACLTKKSQYWKPSEVRCQSPSGRHPQPCLTEVQSWHLVYFSSYWGNWRLHRRSCLWGSSHCTLCRCGSLVWASTPRGNKAGWWWSRASVTGL